MMIYSFSKAAEDDLVDIARFTVFKWSLSQSRIYKKELKQCLETLAQSPLIGRDASEFSQGLLRFPFKAHTIFYIPVKEGIYILRILPQRRKFENLF